MDPSELVTWVERQVVARAATPLPVAYVTLSPKEGSAYPQRARVELAEVASVGDALRDALADIGRAAEAEDRTLARVRVRLYAVKGSTELASTTFRVGHASDEDAPASSVQGETAACLREMRLSMASQQVLIGQMASGAFSLGMQAIQHSAELTKQNGELTGALVIAEEKNAGPLEQLKPLLDSLGPALPMLLARFSPPTP